MSKLETVFRALSTERRRFVLRELQNQGTACIFELAERIAEREAEAGPKQIRSTHLSLLHSDLPLLADAGLVEYDGDAGRVSRTDETTDALAAARDAVEAVVDTA